ncbi:Pentatricopeptide repeat-containing protein [Artemisia annua]|uniref:Pentatricopeptide repeat-containing protein n=1 Tax=Artemisia annua TaxID=35608 RepID=A0A2U1LPG1_ARTAN|nr:Pentatricopeptide repeat-containing protein [Artemisia annua]
MLVMRLERLPKWMHDPNVFVYNAVIRACVCCGSPVEALWFYLKMLTLQVWPTIYTFSSVVKGCALVGECGEGVHGHIWKYGFNSHVFVQTALIDVFVWTSMVSVLARSGEMVSASRLFDEMLERNFASWNSLIDEYLFSKMPEKDLISWTTMINCYLQNKLYQEALATFSDMISHGISPDEVTMATVVSACAHIGALDIGKKIHVFIKIHRFNIDFYIGSALIDMYAKCGSLDQSLSVFYKLYEKNLYCWNSVIDGLGMHVYANEVLKMFNEMVEMNIKPNGVTFISVLSACTHAGMVKEGRECFLRMTRDFNISPEIEHYGCIVDLLCKAGLLEDARLLLINKLMILEPDNSGYYTLLVNMFAEANRWSEFSASDKYHESSKEIYFLLDELCGKLVLAPCVAEQIFGFNGNDDLASAKTDVELIEQLAETLTRKNIANMWKKACSLRFPSIRNRNLPPHLNRKR